MIDDFGEKIPGAAKDRRNQAIDALSLEMSFEVALTRPLAEILPTPDYRGMITEGVDEASVATLRALREQIPTKPGTKRPQKLANWTAQVLATRSLMRRILKEEVDIRTLVHGGAMSETDKVLMKAASGRIRVYMAVGHETPLKGWDIRPFDDRGRWAVRQISPGGRTGRPIAVETSQDAAVAALREKVLARANEARTKSRGPKVGLFQTKTNPRSFVVGAKVRGQFIELERFADLREASFYMGRHEAELEERLKQAMSAPDERGERNRDRTGPDVRRGRDITPELFEETFGFRGVQFGTYMSTGDRQKALEDTFDALHDLARVLRVTPEALSLRGTLALAFGARGKGGRNPAAAHYEPRYAVINLTKHAGAGSLAHEWFHALDNMIPRASGAIAEFATEGRSSLTMAPRLRAAFHGVRDAIRATEMPARSRKLDATRSKPYYATDLEMAARAFEAWVVDQLDRRGAQNDFLANFLDEESFDAASRLRGAPEGRFPYPRPEEIDRISPAFETLFDTPGILAEAQVRRAEPEPLMARPERAEPAREDAAAPAPRDDAITPQPADDVENDGSEAVPEVWI